MTMFSKDDFDRLAEDKDNVLTDGTTITIANGKQLNTIIRQSKKSRIKIVKLLENDADLFEILNGPMNLGILVSATLGTVSDEISDLILKKVAKVTNTNLE